MKDIFLVFDTSCFYEIIILNYFMNYSKCEVVLCSLDGNPVRTMEGYSVNVDLPLNAVDLKDVRSFTVPGGNISLVNTEAVRDAISALRQQGALIAGICAGVDLLEDAGILKNIRSTHSEEENVVNDKKVITARANGFIDFAIEVAKELGLFKDETDLNETIDFWKHHNRMQ